MRLRHVLLWTVVALPSVAAVLLWGLLDGWFIADRSPQAHAFLLEPHLEVARPPGTDPVPAVILFHGCGGVRRGETVRPIMRDYAAIAVDEGVAAVIVDSLTPRGIGYQEALASVCRGYALRGRERAGDVVVAFDMVRNLPGIDGRRIALAGWSHGGWSIMDALALDPRRARPHGLGTWPRRSFDGLAGVFLVYPFCGFPALARNRGFARPTTVEALLVEDDFMADPSACDAAFERVRAGGSTVVVSRLDGVTHAFDESDLDPGAPVRFDAGASERSHLLFRAFLRRVFEN